MNDWTSGYVADIDYTHGYYNELNPLKIKLAFLSAGLKFPEVGTACELGYGQGVSTNVHAAASKVSWWGTDFNPSQANLAQEFSATTGASVFDESFAEFCHREDLPDYDFISLHGIWSWISDENRSLIVDFIRRKLKVGGVLYISYNTLPGWSTAAPLRHLMREHKEVMGARGQGIVKQVEDSLSFITQMMALNPAWAKANPSIAERFKQISQQNRQYLAHEYFNKDWHPMYFADMADYLAAAKLSFACSANYTDFVPAVNLTSEQQDFLKEIKEPNFRQTLRDYMVSQQFRKDYWVKGPLTLSALERTETLRQQAVVLVVSRSDVVLKTKGLLGEITMNEGVYAPILDALADHQPKTLAQLEQQLKAKEISLPQIEQATLLMIGIGYIAPAQTNDATKLAKEKSQTLNKKLIEYARSRSEIAYLSSPVTGGAIRVGRFEQLFMGAILQNHKHKEDWAKYVWQILSAQGQRLMKDGKPLESAEDNLKELTEQAAVFEKKSLPIYKSLQLI